MKIEPKILSKLFAAGIKVKKASYSPYSKFKVGSSLLVKGDIVFSSCNIENAVNGDSVCAEKNVIYHAVASGYKTFTVIVIATDSADFIFPCGSCRQKIIEFSPHCQVYVLNKDGDYQRKIITELLPYFFSDKDLKK